MGETVHGSTDLNRPSMDLDYVSSDQRQSTASICLSASHKLHDIGHNRCFGPGTRLSDTCFRLLPLHLHKRVLRTCHKELWISVKEERSRQDKVEESGTYWPVPGPSSVCIFLNRHYPSQSSMSVASFFGSKNDRRTAAACLSDPLSDTTHWFCHLPYRFCVDFWDVGALREKLHLYSQAIRYAGSLFEVFVQMFGKKAHDLQLGVYPHRQSSVDLIPPLSISSGYFPAGKSADNKPYTRDIPSPPYLASLPIYPTKYSFSGLPVEPSLRPSTPV